MARIGEAELKAHIKNNDFSNAYFIYGDETYLKEFYVGKLKSKLVDCAFEDFNFHQHEGKNSSVDDIIRDAQMLPMMSEYSFVLVHDYPFDKSQSDIDTFTEFLQDLPDSSVVVFWYDSISFDLKKEAKWKKIESAFAKYASSVNIEKRSEVELVKLIESSAKKKKCSISSNNARYLISVVGSDIKTIFNELEKICSFVSNGEITKNDIDTLAVKSLQARIFDLSKFILSGNSSGAYDIINILFAQKEEPVAILAVISSCYVDMYRVKCAKSANVNENELKNYFPYKGKEFLISNASRNCRNLTVEQLRKALDILSETDELLKSTSIDARILLEETIAKLLLLRGA